MPLQELVEQNSIEESRQPHALQDTSRYQRLALVAVFTCCHLSARHSRRVPRVYGGL
ncbi:MAG: hypothetical protein MUC60_09565 [Oscillatoria sp. Prado101]|nr:hypothetical protein [Oscillatoria sp. Prado101]